MIPFKNIEKLCFLAFVFVSMPLFSQQSVRVSGGVVDVSGGAIPSVNLVIKGSQEGTTTGVDGKYSIKAKEGDVLIFSCLGYLTVKKIVGNAGTINVTLSEEANVLDGVVITGNRSKPRTILNSPVPIDNVDVKELQSSGKNTLDRMLTFKVPSFNSQNQAVSDATAHYNPADLRGLGPSRTLVLINGKRKNQSAQVYLNRTLGKGEVGVDLKSIPTTAIERIEVLRDGASAQYGSDAIAGVINIVLKKNVERSTFSAKSGISSKGDGFNFSSDYNTAFNFGNGGFVNLTLAYLQSHITNRAGTPGVADLPKNPRPSWVEWAEANPDLGMHVGQPEVEKKDLFINMEHPLSGGATLYSFHGYTTRTGKSFAYYRAPYWRPDVGDSGFLTAKPEDFVGYQPTFNVEINDHINSAGIKYPFTENYEADVSVTYGSNDVSYIIGNSVNRDYLKDKGTSPRAFENGGYRLSNVIGNFDVTGLISEQISIAFGVEYKKENFEGFEGEPLSYYKSGSDSFPGIKPEAAGMWSRNNFAAYTQLDYDVNEDLLLGVAARHENFSDFGNNFSWKVNGRYTLGAGLVVRASYSTGFRAPTLHQAYITTTIYTPVSGGGEPVLQKTLANDDVAVKALGVPKLFAETSKNISVGATYKFSRNFYASVDFYSVNVADRVLFSSQVTYKDKNSTKVTNPVEQILKDNSVKTVQFFINAGNSKTTGADIVLNYQDIRVGSGQLNLILASNFNVTTLDVVGTPKILRDAGYSIFNRDEKGLIINSRPKSKIVLGINYVINNWNISLNNTRFGQVTITAPSGGFDSKGMEITKKINEVTGERAKDQDLEAKISTDIVVSYTLADGITLNALANNIFDVYPEKTLKSTGTTQAANRYTYSSEVQQLGILGANFSIGLNYQF